LDKAPGAFRTISEVADEIDVPQHVLRFWESRFTQIRPMKRGGGRRFYRPEDVDLLRGVRHLLYGEGYTIRGVQRILREEGLAFVHNVWRAGAHQAPPLRDEEKTDEAVGEQPTAGRSGPDLSVFALLKPTTRPPGDQRPAERREPTLAPAAPALLTAQPARRGIPAEAKQRLQATLDELLACQRLLIEAAFTGDEPLVALDQDRGT